MRTRGRRGACSAPSHCQTTVWLTETALASSRMDSPAVSRACLSALANSSAEPASPCRVPPSRHRAAACLMNSPSVEISQPFGKDRPAAVGSSIDAWQVVCLQSCPPCGTWSDEEGAGDGVAPPRRARSHQPRRSGPGARQRPRHPEHRSEARCATSLLGLRRAPQRSCTRARSPLCCTSRPRRSPAGPRTASCRSSAPSAGTAASPSAIRELAARLVGECGS